MAFWADFSYKHISLFSAHDYTAWAENISVLPVTIQLQTIRYAKFVVLPE